ncbi:GntR family transcriptional regulator [Paracoccus sp. Z118]|uniref:GntR family transcriptional regulator n=1 Tax=Paracoccus sp. Z118 TaxID=2851017 RepID=UPI001C2C53FF|nr:GntR family transcriptional regulator [Paracoccus sp. Z118]MBV0893326.1 GntR family transcriptional regulator [Paracoccus sp. Z118]
MTERDGARIIQILRDSILRLELRPGVILDEAELAQRLDVSRTPIREAIIQLIADRLVVREGRKAKVAPLDFDDMPKLYDALLISSRLVHRLAAENRTDRDLRAIAREMEAFERSTQGGDGVSRSQANVAFHAAISAATDNPYISAFYEQALNGTIRLARACFDGPNEFGDETTGEDLAQHLAETRAQHRGMYEAIRAQDIEASDRLAVDHYTLTKKRIIQVLSKQSPALSGIADLTLDSWKMP